jgi:hypothetical protein
VIVGGVSLKAAPAARQDNAETASIIVNGRKGLYEHGHRGDPAVPVSNATSTGCLGFVLGGKVHPRPSPSIFSVRARLSAMPRNYVVFGDIEGKPCFASNAPSAAAEACITFTG